MTNIEAVNKIKEILGLSKLQFASMVTSEGVEIRAEVFEVGQPLYVITPNGAEPCPDGEYTIEDGSVVKCVNGLIDSIELEPTEVVEEVVETTETALEEEVTEEVKFVEAELIDGTLVSTEDQPLEVGVKLVVITPEGKIDAPEGQHTTKEGLVITVGEGGIIETIEEMVEITEEEEEMSSELVETFTSAIQMLKNEINELRKENVELKDKFLQFSKKPAGEPIKSVKTFSSEGVDVVSKLKNLQTIKNNLKK